MERLLSKNLIKKIAIIILFIMSFNIIVPTSMSFAAKSYLKIDDDDKKKEEGSTLFTPIMDFLVFLADSVLNILQHNFISEHDVVETATSSDNGHWSWGWLGAALIGVVVIIVGVASVVGAVYSGGSTIPLGAVIIGSLTAIGGAAATVVSVENIIENLGGEYDLPFIAYNPYAIFSGKIPALDINFINPMQGTYRYIPSREEALNALIKKNIKDGKFTDKEIFQTLENYDYDYNNNNGVKIQKNNLSEDDINNLTKYGYFASENNFIAKEIGTIYGFPTEKDYWEHNGKFYYIFKQVLEIQDMPGYWFDCYIYEITVDVPAKQIDEYINSYTEENSTQYESSGKILQNSIATWYKVLRRFALVGLLSVLVYIGIRIILTAVAADKAKYKKMFIDWLMAVCMLFVLHYLMIFILTLASNLTSIFETAGAYNIQVGIPNDTKINGVYLKDTNVKEYNDKKNIKIDKQLADNSIYKDSKNNVYLWDGDFIGYIRLRAGYTSRRSAIAYGLMYLVLVIDICIFTFMYLRRVLYMAFLTMIAPLIALTYPLDRIKDGKAQAFSMWLREYIFNALIQPIHLILYTMIISNVLKLAIDHPVYAIVALGFIMPAEKFIRQMFGFGQASTLSPLGGFAGGALVMSAINSLSRLGKHKGKGNDKKEQNKVRTADKDNPKLPKFDATKLSGKSEGTKPLEGKPGDPKKKSANTEKKETPVKVKKTDTEKASPSEKPKPELKNEPTTTKGKSVPTKASTVKAKKLTKRARFKNALMSVGNRGKNRILKAKPLRFAGRLAAKGVGAATLGTVGLAAGISSGEFKNVLGYTAAGGAAGWALGGKVGNAAMDKMHDVKEDFKEGYLGKDEYNNRQLDKEYFRGKGFQEMLDNHSLMPDVSGPARVSALKEEIEAYRAAGITDNSQIANLMKSGLPSDKAIITGKITEQLKGLGLDKKNKSAWKTNGPKELEEKFGFSSSEAKTAWKIIESNL